MAKKKPKPKLQLVRWSKNVPATSVQDPLGLGLRGSTRLAGRLLHCITSITPRARYFSYIPWCIRHFQTYEKGQPHALGLREAIKIREAALTLACVLHHDGKTCEGGNLVGSNKASGWDQTSLEADFKKLKFAKVPALDAYFNSLVNLGCFLTEEERDESEEAEKVEFTFNDIELSPLGIELAKSYDSSIGRLDSVKTIANHERKCSAKSLREWGKRGGLCELTDDSSSDRDHLLEMFFAKEGSKKDSHWVRNRSLVLNMELCKQLSEDGWDLSEPHFSMAVYYGTIVSDDERFEIQIPNCLTDISVRWRMFYFHHYMAVALEGMFTWLTTTLFELGVSGATTKELSELLNESTVQRQLAEFFKIEITSSFGESKPSEFFKKFGLEADTLDKAASESIDQIVSPENKLAEHWLEDSIRNRQFLDSSTGLAAPMILFVLTMGRYYQWAESDYGKWLASVANDPYLDLGPPGVLQGMEQHFGQWWSHSWANLTDFVLSRYVVQQHQALAFEKTDKGDRCLLQVDGAKVIAELPRGKIGIKNLRFSSAMQILKDLALLEADENKITRLTKEGQTRLDAELQNGGGN